MIRIEVPEKDAADPYGHASRNYAREIMAAAGGFSKAVYQHSLLSLREFEGARSRTAQINGCIICQQFRAARDEWQRADPAQGDARTQFYIAYSCIIIQISNTRNTI